MHDCVCYTPHCLSFGLAVPFAAQPVDSLSGSAAACSRRPPSLLDPGPTILRKKADKGTLPHSCTPHHTPTHTVRRQEFSWRSCSHPLASLLTPLSFCCCCCCCPPQISPRPPNPLRPATARPSASNPADTEHTASTPAQRHPALLRHTHSSHRQTPLPLLSPQSCRKHRLRTSPRHSGTGLRPPRRTPRCRQLQAA